MKWRGKQEQNQQEESQGEIVWFVDRVSNMALNIVTALAHLAVEVTFNKNHPAIHSQIGCYIVIFTGDFISSRVSSDLCLTEVFLLQWGLVLSNAFLHLLKWIDALPNFTGKEFISSLPHAKSRVSPLDDHIDYITYY